MKGIAHFVTGVAIATFFPEIVQGAAQSLAFGPLLGGLAALLPDTLDFKFSRYWVRRDVEVDPARITTGGGQPDPQAMAERIAAAIERAAKGGRPVEICLHTFRLGADLWRQYSVVLDPVCSQVAVHLGPVVTTSQVPYPDSEVAGLMTGRAQAGVRILPTYDGEIQVDIFSGPSLCFKPAASGAVEVVFLPWHRAWTHSLAMALAMSALGSLHAPVYGLVMGLGVLAHILQDQLGYMGSNLFFPLTRSRTAGLRLFHSGEAIPNLLSVWVGCAAILFNLDRFSGEPAIPALPYLLGVVVGPGLLLVGLHIWSRRRAMTMQRQAGPAPSVSPPRGIAPRFPLSPAAMAAAELLVETDEVDI